MKNSQIVYLEPSTHTHYTKSDIEIVQELSEMNTLVLKLNDNMIVEHGEHHTVATEEDTKVTIKIIQQEFNPVTRALRNAFD